MPATCRNDADTAKRAGGISAAQTLRQVERREHPADVAARTRLDALIDQTTVVAPPGSGGRPLRSEAGVKPEATTLPPPSHRLGALPFLFTEAMWIGGKLRSLAT